MKEISKLKKLNTPIKIQDFLDQIPFNHEKFGETCYSALKVLEKNKAHCIEGAFLSALCLKLNNEKPIILSLKVNDKSDFDHIITIYKRNGYYGAISKTNHLVLRFRDPVYKSIRELVMSYFHEYFLTKNGKKTLIGYSKPINLDSFGDSWIYSEKDQWEIAEAIYNSKITKIIPEKNKRFIRNATKYERSGDNLVEWNK